MALQNLAERSMRILVATVNEANMHIFNLTTALQAQQEYVSQLLANLWRRDIEINEISMRLADLEHLIAQLREEKDTLQAGLASERLQGEIFREELESERLLRTQIQDVLQRRSSNHLDAWQPHFEPVLPGATSEIAEPAQPAVPQTRQATIPAILTSVPMTREPAYRRHGEPKAE